MFEYIKCDLSEDSFSQLRKIHKECMKKNIEETLGSWDEHFQYERLKKHYLEYGNTLLFIKYNNEIIGTVNHHIKKIKQNDKTVEVNFVEQLYVLPKYQNKGLGSLILSEIESGKDELYLSVLKNDKKAINFYIKNGYKIYSEDKYQKFFNKINRYKKDEEMDLIAVSRWLKTDIKNIEIEEREENIDLYKQQIKEMLFSYTDFKKEEKRTLEIIKKINNGDESYPIYVDRDDEFNFILEGRHRIVAFYLLGYKTVKVRRVALKDEAVLQFGVGKLKNNF